VTEAAFRVTGRVQGVGYRWWTRVQATRLGLEGSVRNCADGSVEVRLRGPAGVVARMRALLAEGPPGAAVRSVDELPAASVPADGFSIDR
jgi:acylphosphatase